MSTPDPTRDTPSATRPGGVTCEHCVEFLLDYVDGVLPDAQRSAFEAHLAGCPNCETYLDNYRKAAELTAATGRSARAGAAGDVPPGLVDAILKARKADPR